MDIPCAFCRNPAVKKGGEHMWSDWINRIRPSSPYNVLRFDEKRNVNRYKKKSLDMKVPAVCASCNNGWMSDLESRHAKPAMQDLITSDRGVLLRSERLRSIAAFAFKSAVIADHASLPGRQPFFSESGRHAFASFLNIPGGVQMWIAALEHDSNGIFRAQYHETPADVERGFELYVFTFGAGHLLFQVVGCRWLNPRLARNPYPRITQGNYWNKFSIPFWPPNGNSILWPPKPFTLKWANNFSHRWQLTDWA